MSKTYKLTLNLPGNLNHVDQRILEGHDDVVVARQGGYVGGLTDEQLKVAKADPYIIVEKPEKAGSESTEGSETAAQKKARLAAEKKAKADEKKSAEEAAKTGEGQEDPKAGEVAGDSANNDQEEGQDATGSESTEGSETANS